MHSLVTVVVVASLAFIGTMFDNFFAFAAQLIVTKRENYPRVAWAQALGVLTLLVIAAGVGSLLAPIPTRWIGLLCVAPWALAWYSFQHRHDPAKEQFRRGAITTFTLTLALGGDNLAVWIPLLRANGVAKALVTAAVFAAFEVLFVVTAQSLASHPSVVQWGRKHGPTFIPWVYVALGALVLYECGTLSFA